jgi:hypothetical protein
MGVKRAGAAVTGELIAIALTASPGGVPGESSQASPSGLRGAVPPGTAETVAGARWNAGLWRAALVAAATLGKDVPDLALSAMPAGSIEGVAASALIATGWIAAHTGAAIDPSATVAGSIELDGTIGPVAGLPEQLSAAIAGGKTRLGVPAGMRLARSEATGQLVDVVQLARAHRAEVIELATVADAFALLTRTRLPAPVAVSEAEMALDADAQAALEAAYVAWQRRLAGEWAALLELEQAGRLPAAIQAMVRLAKERSAAAETLHEAGTLAAAVHRIASAWVHAAGANRTYAVVAKLQRGDIDGALALLAAFAAPGEPGVEATLAQLTASPATSLAGQLRVRAALEAALRGGAYLGFAGDELRLATPLLTGFHGKPPAELSAPSTAEQVTIAVAPVVVMALRTEAELRCAALASALDAPATTADARPEAVTSSPESVARRAATLEAAAVAELGLVDALLVEPIAHRAGLSIDQARRRVAAAEPDYLIAAAVVRAAIEDPRRALAAQQLALASATALVARSDAFAIRLDASGAAIAVEPAEAFHRLLDLAARRARAAARAARIATGAIPAQAKLAYQLARVERAGGLDDQLDALADLWASSAASRAAVALARD